MLDNLENIVESILFVAGDAVDVSDICGKIDATKAEVMSAVKKLEKRYGENSGISIQSFNGKIQLSSNPLYAEEVSLVLNPIRQRNLSRATLETAAIIAYKQPITRLEIEDIRGVSSDYAISVLLEHGLIEIVGKKDTVGHPTLFGTTDEFLKRFNMETIDNLPDYNELMDKIKIIRSSDERLYNHFEIKEEQEDQKNDLDVAVAIDEPEESGNMKEIDAEKQDDGNDYFKDDHSGTSQFFNGQYVGDDGNDYFKNDESGDEGFFEDDELV